MKIKAYTNWRNIELWNSGNAIQIRLTHSLETDVEIEIPVKKVKFLTNQVSGTYIIQRTLRYRIKEFIRKLLDKDNK